jgi:hypothetical protein
MMSGQISLNTYCRRNTGTRRGEHREKGVALSALLLPPVINEFVANDLVVVRQNLGVRIIAKTSQQRR